MVLVFRTDSSYTIGLGHIMRCMTLARALSRLGHAVHFISRENEGNIIGMLEKEYPVQRLERAANNFIQENNYASWLGQSWETDFEETTQALSQIADKPVDWLISDHYGIDWQWESAIKNHVSRLMVIDDLANRKHHCDILLDQTFGRCSSDYRSLVNSTCELFLGAQYILLRDVFFKLREKAIKKRAMTKQLKTVLITMGGTDPHNMTQWIIDVLMSASLPLHYDIVLGPQAKHRESILSQTLPSNVHIHENVSDMENYMLRADLSISAAGMTAWERCCLGLPTLLIVTAENQWNNAKQLSNSGAVDLMGDSSNLQPRDLLSRLNKYIAQPTLLQKISKNAEKICDGWGVNRVIQILGSYNENLH